MIKREKAYFSLLTFEKKLLHWLILERHKIVLIFLIAILMWGLSLVPYFNLFVSTSLIMLVVIVLSLVLFKVPPDRMVLLALLLFLPAALGVVLEEQGKAELISAYIYGILLLGTVLTLLKSRE